MSRPPRLRHLLTALLWLAACGEGSPSVLLVTIDTLRADHLGAYGAADAYTPHLDALAREATVFERASAPMPLTRPSHFSMLTARYPREHGVLNNYTALPEAETTLAEILAARGYRTAAFLAVRLLGEDSGAAQGFEVFDSPRETIDRAAQSVVPAALAWLAALPRKAPFFLWVHLFEPHLPYAPPPAFRQLDPAAQRLDLMAVDWPQLAAAAQANDGDVPAELLAYARALYRAEVSTADHWVGQLLEGVASRRDLDRVLLIVTADHGECFEHGIYFEHSDCLYEGAVHVPLLVRHPTQFPAQRLDVRASLIDVGATVLEAVGAELPANASGRPLQRAAGWGERPVLVEHPFYERGAAGFRASRAQIIRSVAGRPAARPDLAQHRTGVVAGGWKYLRARADGDSEELYRLPDEEEDRSGERPKVRAELRAALDELIERYPLRVVEPERVNDELLETLRALGYVR